jgi:hypothetical protein
MVEFGEHLAARHHLDGIVRWRHDIVPAFAGPGFGHHSFVVVKVVLHHLDAGLFGERFEYIGIEVFLPDKEFECLRLQGGEAEGGAEDGGEESGRIHGGSADFLSMRLRRRLQME